MEGETGGCIVIDEARHFAYGNRTKPGVFGMKSNFPESYVDKPYHREECLISPIICNQYQTAASGCSAIPGDL